MRSYFFYWQIKKDDNPDFKMLFQWAIFVYFGVTYMAVVMMKN